MRVGSARMTMHSPRGSGIRAAVAVAIAVLAGSSGRAAERPKPVVEFGHLTACVSDPEATSRFLERALGWRVLQPRSGADVSRLPRDTIRVTDSRGFGLHLRKATSSGPTCTGAPYETLTFVTADLGAAAASLTLPVPKRAVRSIEVPRVASAGTPVIVATSAGSRPKGPATSGRSASRVDRIAIFVADLEKAAAFYTDSLGLARSTASVQLDGAANARSGGLRVAFIDARGVWLALVQPVGPGPLMDFLMKNGDGYIAELIVEVDDLAAEYDRMQASGVTLVDTRGEPVDPREKAHVLVPYGDRIAYFPTPVAGGLVIELAQRGPAETSLLERRDRAPKVFGAPR